MLVEIGILLARNVRSEKFPVAVDHWECSIHKGIEGAGLKSGMLLRGGGHSEIARS